VSCLCAGTARAVGADRSQVEEAERGQSALVGGGVELRPPASVVGSRAGGWMGMGAARAAGGDGCGTGLEESGRCRVWRPSPVGDSGGRGIVDLGGREGGRGRGED